MSYSKVNQIDKLLVVYGKNPKYFRELLSEQIKEIVKKGYIPRVFIDIRGIFINIHDKHGKELCRKYNNNDVPAYSREIIQIVNNWISVFKEYKLNPVIVPFAEFGTLDYHLRLEPKYKVHRKETALKDCGFKLIQESSAYINKEILATDWIFKTKGTNVCTCISENVEFDALPHLLIKEFPEHITTFSEDEEFDPYSEETPTKSERVLKNKYYNIILTKDKDISQSIDDTTVIVSKKVRGEYYVVDKNNIGTMLKLKGNIPPHWVSVALGIAGDSSDGFKGVPGLGPVAVYDFINKYYKEIDKIDKKNNYRRLVKFLSENDFDCKIFKKFKNGVLKHKRSFSKSFMLADFDILIGAKLTKPIVEQHIEKYKRVIFSEPDISKLSGKKDFLKDKFENKFGIKNQMKYYQIINNTLK